MDPSIMKLLEDDEDETMHSGADVEAFTAALNRDIEGDTSTSQPSDPESAMLSQGSNQGSKQLFQQWQTSNKDETINSQSHPSEAGKQPSQIDTSEDHNRHALQQKSHNEQNPPQFAQPSGNQIPVRNPIASQNREPDKMTRLEGAPQYAATLQQINNNQPAAMEINNNQPSNPLNRGKQVPFALLLPVILPQLDKDRAMQLQTLYSKLKNNEIPKDGFVRHMRGIVGDQMLKLAVLKLQQDQAKSQVARSSQAGPTQFQPQSQAPAQQHHIKMPSVTAQQFNDPHSFSQLHQKAKSTHLADQSHVATSAGQAQTDSSMGVANHGLNNKQHLHFSQQSFPMYGSSGGNYHSFSAPKGPQPHDSSQIRQVPLNQSMGSSGQSMNMMGAPKFERQNSINDIKRVVQQRNNPSPPVGHVKQEPIDQGNERQRGHLSTPQGLSSFPEKGNAITGNSTSSNMPQLDSNLQAGPRIPPATSLIGSSNIRTPPKKPTIGQKKPPLETLGSSPPLPSKKQKVSGGLLDQSIEQLNDVTAVSGVNLREEEEQLFSGAKEESRISEASRRVVQEEEERLLLEKIPLQKKLAQIMAKCGLKGVSNDVGRCLSLCVEERMRGLISNLIRLSKQRVDVEKQRHRVVITSDVRHQISLMNRKARDELEKKQAEAEKLRRLNEPEGTAGVDGDKDKDDGRVKSLKVNKEEDDKMRTTAANVAARAAVGGDDMLSKWQMMAEQAKQKREGGVEGSSSKDMSRSKPLENVKEHQEIEKRTHPPVATFGTVRKLGRNQLNMPQTRVARNISIKDVIAVLEREPQMSKSTMIYRLYEKLQADTAAD